MFVYTVMSDRITGVFLHCSSAALTGGVLVLFKCVLVLPGIFFAVGEDFEESVPVFAGLLKHPGPYPDIFQLGSKNSQ